MIEWVFLLGTVSQHSTLEKRKPQSPSYNLPPPSYSFGPAGFISISVPTLVFNLHLSIAKLRNEVHVRWIPIIIR